VEATALTRRFIELFHASGWSQVEMARRMDRRRGGSNGIVTGPALPTSGLRTLAQAMLKVQGVNFAKPCTAIRLACQGCEIVMSRF